LVGDEGAVGLLREVGAHLHVEEVERKRGGDGEGENGTGKKVRADS
jgi:hypothetical protein